MGWSCDGSAAGDQGVSLPLEAGGETEAREALTWVGTG